VNTVIVAGNVVLVDGEPTQVNESDLYDELASYRPLIESAQLEVEARHRHLGPYLEQLRKSAAGIELVDQLAR
jgi:hypothetical protein